MQIIDKLIFFLSIYVKIASSKKDPDAIDIHNVKKIGRFIIGEDPVPRNEAKKNCENAGGQLMVIRTHEDIVELIRTLDKVPNADVFWIGGLYKHSNKCTGHSFQVDCWHWEDKYYTVYDPSLIAFDDEVKVGKPPKIIGMLLKYGEELSLTYDAVGGPEHPYICDLNPPPAENVKLK